VDDYNDELSAESAYFTEEEEGEPVAHGEEQGDAYFPDEIPTQEQKSISTHS